MKKLMLALMIMCGLMLTSTAFAQAFVSVQIAPPPLPIYAQPPCPAPGYLWTPGYWAYSAADGGYFWVPGTWVLPPQPGYLWTPGYWAWNGTFFVWRSGYWGSNVGFYGGINYGYGYFGTGYYGGYWRHRRFYYNREVNNINVTVIHNSYRRGVAHRGVNHISYNGGHGGVNLQPRRDHGDAHGPRVAATHAQIQHRNLARGNRAQFDRFNHGRPGVAATARPGSFNGFDAAHDNAAHAARPVTHPQIKHTRTPVRQAPHHDAVPRAPARRTTPPQRRQSQPRPQVQTGPQQVRPHPQARPPAPAQRLQQHAAPQDRPQQRAAPAQHRQGRRQAPHEDQRQH